MNNVLLMSADTSADTTNVERSGGTSVPAATTPRLTSAFARASTLTLTPNSVCVVLVSSLGQPTDVLKMGNDSSIVTGGSVLFADWLNSFTEPTPSETAVACG